MCVRVCGVVCVCVWYVCRVCDMCNMCVVFVRVRVRVCARMCMRARACPRSRTYNMDILHTPYAHKVIV